MLAFIFRRTILMVVVLWCVVTLTFVLVRLSPGSPFARERKLSPETEAQMKREYNLDGPLWQQYGTYLGLLRNPDGEFHGLLEGYLGSSVKMRGRQVADLISQNFPVSALLGFVAFCVASIVGVWLGALAAVRHHSFIDRSSMLVALVLISIPAFVTGPLLVLVFALKLRWLPVGGWNTLSSVLLPSVTLAGPYIAYIARLMRASMLEVLKQDFVRTALAKGLAERRVIYQHALKVAILPVVTYLGPLAANLLTGSIVVEAVFNLPGIGSFFVSSILNHDDTLLLGVTIIYCTLLIGLNLLVDIAYSWLDPRIRLGA
ncbi:MAG TPA: ABC transporter permease [Chthoniobacteraceae bacterium]|jgi:oligopeptide transport system permease protein|nr:ABC transporter permease [Chthoniobacteraceae bacterium]